MNPRTALRIHLNGLESPRLNPVVGTTERTSGNVLNFSGNHNNC